MANIPCPPFYSAPTYLSTPVYSTDQFVRHYNDWYVYYPLQSTISCISSSPLLSVTNDDNDVIKQVQMPRRTLLQRTLLPRLQSTRRRRTLDRGMDLRRNIPPFRMQSRPRNDRRTPTRIGRFGLNQKAHQFTHISGGKSGSHKRNSMV